jgi:outer membrane protein
MHKNRSLFLHSSSILTIEVFRKYRAIKILIIFIFIFYLFPGMDLTANENSEVLYDMEKSIQEAFNNSWSIKEKEEKIRASEFEEKAAFADFLPTLKTIYDFSRNDIVGITSGNSFEWTTSIIQPLFKGFAITSAYELARLNTEQDRLDLAQEKLDLSLKIKNAYFDILRVTKVVEVAEHEVESYLSHLNAAREFYETGSNTVNDLLRAEVDLANSRQSLSNAQKDEQLAMARFNALLSRPIDSNVEVEDIINAEPVSADFKGSVEKALKSRPEIKALDIKDAQIDQEKRSVRSRYYPEIDLTYSYIKEGDTFDFSGDYPKSLTNRQIAAGMTWTFWDWGKTRNLVNKYESNRKQLIQNRKSLENNIKIEIKTAILDLTNSGKNILTAKKAVDQAEESLRVSNERYMEKVGLSTEVLDAQKYLSRARLNYYNALYDNNLAKAALMRAMGEY